MADLKSRNSRNTNPKPSPHLQLPAKQRETQAPQYLQADEDDLRFYKTEDPSITWWMLGGFIIPAALIVGLGFILRNGWIGWILNIITALLLGFPCNDSHPDQPERSSRIQTP